MPQHPFNRPRGRIEILEVESVALADNLLGDPPARSVAVYLPEGYDDSSDEYPLMVDLVGYTGSGLAHVSWKAFQENIPQLLICLNQPLQNCIRPYKNLKQIYPF